jgi:uncharacterized cupredoxin-like copper-binding protein
MRTFLALALLATATSVPAQDFSKAAVVNVTLADYKFMPMAIQLKAGRPVILRLRNAAEQPHEFAAPDFFRNATVRAADAKSINAEGEAEVQPGKQVDIALIPKAGSYSLQCNKPGHLALGMKGSIVVR